MFSKKIFLVIICLFVGINLFASRGSKRDKKPSPTFSIDELNQLYERGVKSWESGNGRNSFYTLDSLRKIDITSENALIKSKGMIYLAKCFYSQKNYRYAINYLNLALVFGKDILQY